MTTKVFAFAKCVDCANYIGNYEETCEEKIRVRPYRFRCRKDIYREDPNEEKLCYHFKPAVLVKCTNCKHCELFGIEGIATENAIGFCHGYNTRIGMFGEMDMERPCLKFEAKNAEVKDTDDNN